MLVAGIAAVIDMRREKRRRLALLRDRPDLSIDDIYSMFYAASGLSRGSVTDAWSAIANILGVKPGQLRPEDSLQWLNTSRFRLQTDMDDLEVFCNVRGTTRPKDGEVRTIDDAVKILCKRKTIEPETTTPLIPNDRL